MRSSFIGLGGWLKNSFIDYPGHISSVLFYNGCNLRCPYCHNPSVVKNSEDISFKSDEIWDFFEKRKNLIEGVVFSGGEPTIHKDIPEKAGEFKKLGYKIKLDTNGLIPERIKQIQPDYLALDIKTLPEYYRYFLYAAYDDIEVRLKKSLAILKSMNTAAEVRITAAPRILNRKVIKEIGQLLDGVKRVYLQPMRQKAELMDKEYGTIGPLSGEEIERFREILLRYVESCTIRGS